MVRLELLLEITGQQLSILLELVAYGRKARRLSPMRSRRRVVLGCLGVEFLDGVIALVVAVRQVEEYVMFFLVIIFK